MTQAEKELTLRHFEGLVKTTAAQIVACGVELEFEDISQLLRIKVWHAVEKFDAERAAASQYLSRARDKHGRTPLERYVFTCVANLRKDIEKRPRRYNSSIEEIRERVFDEVGTIHGELKRADWFDLRFLSVDHETVYGAVEDSDELTLPSTLTETERRLVTLRMDGRLLMEIDRELGLSRAERERVMRSVREKLADWRPSAGERRSAPRPPLPRAVPSRDDARSPLAA